MHPAVRVLGWCLLVAALVGLLWPERAEPPNPTAMGAEGGKGPAPSTARAPSPCAPLCAAPLAPFSPAPRG